jgi:GNAT superfamily N-acetyltransferase
MSIPEVRKAESKDWQNVRDFVYSLHLQLSVRNEDELRRQTLDLPTDFPLLENAEMFSSSSSHVFLAEHDGKLIGAVGMLDGEEEIDDSEDAECQGVIHSSLNFLFVDPEHRRRGLGTAFLQRILSLDGRRRVKLVSLRFIYDDAIRLYQSFGFTVFKEFKAHDYDVVEMILDTCPKS